MRFARSMRTTVKAEAIVENYHHEEGCFVDLVPDLQFCNFDDPLCAALCGTLEVTKDRARP